MVVDVAQTVTQFLMVVRSRYNFVLKRLSTDPLKLCQYHPFPLRLVVLLLAAPAGKCAGYIPCGTGIVLQSDTAFSATPHAPCIPAAPLRYTKGVQYLTFLHALPVSLVVSAVVVPVVLGFLFPVSCRSGSKRGVNSTLYLSHVPDMYQSSYLCFC